MPARFKYFMTRILHGSATRRPFDVSVSPESYSFRLCRVIRSLLETCPLCRLRRHNMTMIKFYPLPSLPTLTKYFICYSVSAFSFYLKKKTPAKEKQTQGFAPRPRERRAAVHSLLFSVGSSAHSPANAQRALCSLFFANIASLYPPPAVLRRRCPRSQIACYTAARLLEACSSGFIKSFALLFPGLQQFIISNVNHRPQRRDMFSARVSLT